MASYNNYSDNWYVTVNGGTGTFYLDAALQVNGNITYVSQLAVNDAFIIAGANNNATANVTAVGFLAGKPTDPISYAGIQYNATDNAWQISTDVLSNGTANTVPYSNIVYAASGSNTQVQFNDNGVFGSSAAFSFDNSSNTLSVTNFVTNFISSDDSSFVMIADGLNVSGDIEAQGYIIAGNVISDSSITPSKALADLTATDGARAFVNDSNLAAAGNFGAQIASGGGNLVPVWSDGSYWYIG